MTQETEIKLRVSNPQQANALLHDHGFQIHKPRIFERNLVFDMPDLPLFNSRRLLRLRQAGSEVTLTFKGPSETSGGRHKSREEREVKLENFDEMQVILERLGYQVTFTYDKHRTEYTVPNSSGIATGIATIDETPVGTFMELEGEAVWIDKTAAELGFTPEQYITANYATLYSAGQKATV